MTHIVNEVRSGTYYDSVVLMQLQKSILALKGVLDVGVMMGTEANRDVLEQSGLLTEDSKYAAAEDLIIAIKAESAEKGKDALDSVDMIMSQRQSSQTSQDFRPRSLITAVRSLPDARWVLISVPGRYAVDVALEALDLGKNVFLYSDNVSLDDEILIKKSSLDKGLLVMGPDCGTAVINGVGFGFANVTKTGPVGVVAASGTGLQALTVSLDGLGSGVSHAFGTGGRDLKDKVGGITSKQALSLLAGDNDTQVIVLTSKPLASEVAIDLIRFINTLNKPVVVNFLGFVPLVTRIGNVFFAKTLHEASDLAVKLSSNLDSITMNTPVSNKEFAPSQRYVRCLFSGGTLAYETLLVLNTFAEGVYSNIAINSDYKLHDVSVSKEHTVIDMGEDEYTLGRLHPMMDYDLRLRRLRQESEDEETAVILLDVVLGHGSHPNPSAELASMISDVKSAALSEGRYLEIVVLVIGTENDPQELSVQIESLRRAGAHVETCTDKAASYVGNIIMGLSPYLINIKSLEGSDIDQVTQVSSIINVGLEYFHESLIQQGVQSTHVDWQPPAQGNEKLMDILAKMKS